MFSNPNIQIEFGKKNVLEEEEEDDNSNYSDVDAVDFEYNSKPKEEDDHQQFKYETEKYEENKEDNNDDDGDVVSESNPLLGDPYFSKEAHSSDVIESP